MTGTKNERHGRKERKKLEGNRDASPMWREDATHGTYERDLP
jgi:hypothetical protein